MNKTLRKIIFIALFIGMLCPSACLEPIDDSFNKSESGPKTLVINEIVAAGGNDWIELYVDGNDSIYLGDYSIVDDNIERDPFPLPDITLGPREFFFLFATDEAPEDSSFPVYYVPFRLGANDSLTLYWGLAIVDVLDWEEGQAPDGCSYGLFPDGTGVPSTLLPTQGKINKRIFRPSLVVNEIVASAAYGGDDWIELYVDSNDPVYLGDYSLVDDAAGRKPEPLPDITLAPGEFIVIYATGEEDPNCGSYCVPFRLDTDGDSVTLYKDSNIVDVLDWEDGDAPIGYSYGCLPDGTKLNGTKALQTLIPTPGEANKG